MHTVFMYDLLCIIHYIYNEKYTMLHEAFHHFCYILEGHAIL